MDGYSLVDDSKTMRGIVQRRDSTGWFSRPYQSGRQKMESRLLEKLSAEQPSSSFPTGTCLKCRGIDSWCKVRASQNKVPFGFITSEASAAIKRELAMKSGASFLLTKPFSPEPARGFVPDSGQVLTPCLSQRPFALIKSFYRSLDLGYAK